MKHVDTYGGLDICINCAGIANQTLVYDDISDGSRTWRHAINVNFVAVIDGTRIAVSVDYCNNIVIFICSVTQSANSVVTPSAVYAFSYCLDILNNIITQKFA